MKVLLTTLFSLFLLIATGQTNDTIEVIKGPNKYKKEVIEIYNSYSNKIDSLQADRINKMTKDSLYAENEMKTRPEKYKHFDGGIIGYLMNEEDKKITIIINRFLNIDKITSSSKEIKSNGLTEYHFYYTRIQKSSNGVKILIPGVVIWQE